MGVYVKGMEMPTEFSFDYLAIVIYADGTIRSIHGNVIEGATAVPVPPHGRLIDADALIKELALDDEDDNSGASLLMAIFLEVLKAASTIIPAEDG